METNIAQGLRFSILDREFKKKLEERANRMGLTAVQLRVLGELSRAESMGACEINQKDLEKALAVTHPTMTEIIKRLEKKKAVICTQSKVDARYKKINCADEYKNIHIELKKMDWEIFNKICAGIPEEDIQHIFHSFYRASNTREYAGQGIGLSLSMKIVSVYGGKIAIESQVESYTKVTMTFTPAGELE